MCSSQASTVSDLQAALDWYGRLFGRPPDIVVNDDEVMWHIAAAGWLYVLNDSDRAGHALVTLAVADLDQSVEEIASRGIRCGAIEIIGNAGRKAAFTDPDGNIVSYIEVDRSTET